MLLLSVDLVLTTTVVTTLVEMLDQVSFQDDWHSIYRYFLVTNLYIIHSCNVRSAATVGKRSCVGERSCNGAGEHRPYSYIRMYFLTSTKPSILLDLFERL